MNRCNVTDIMANFYYRHQSPFRMNSGVIFLVFSTKDFNVGFGPSQMQRNREKRYIHRESRYL